MARTPFSVSIAGRVSGETHGGPVNLVSVAATAAENAVGTQRRKPLGWLPPRSYQLDHDVKKLMRGSASYVGKTTSGIVTGFANVTGEIGGTSGAFVCVTDSDRYSAAGLKTRDLAPTAAQRNVALEKARIKFKQQDVNLGVAFAEANKTARLVGDNATKIAKALQALRRRDVPGMLDSLGVTKPRHKLGLKDNSIPKTWLEYQYGWKPLLSDVYGSVDALAKRDRHDWRVTSKATEADTFDVDRLLNSTYHHRHVQAKVSRGVFARIDAVPENDLLIALSSLGITNPGVVAWELVPFSFVIDWFLPIGRFLDQVDAMLGYTDQHSSVTSFLSIKASIEGRNGITKSGIYTYDAKASGSGTWRHVYLRRQATSGFVPRPSFPSFRDPRSLTRMANGLALLSQVMR